MKLSLTASNELPLVALASLAGRAEAAGLHGLWRAEGVSWDAFTVCALWAERTRHIQLATGIVSAITRMPGALARAAATVTELSGGRFRLGLGVGNNPEVPQPKSPLGEIERVTIAVRDHLRAPLVPEVTQPAPGIWLAALRPKMVDLAARIADGVLLTWATPDYVRQVRQLVGPSYPIACTVRALAGRRTEGPAELRDHFEVYRRRPVYQRHFANQGLDADRLSDQDLLRFVVRHVDDLETWRAAGVDELVIRPVGDDWWPLIEEFARSR